MSYDWQFDVVWKELPYLLRGLWLTVTLSVATMVTGLVLGLVVALARLSRVRALRTFAALYVDVLRGLPILTILLWIYFTLPIITGIGLSSFVSGWVGLSLNLGAFIAEIFRAGISSVERGQREAALALGMVPRQAFSRIVFPQAVRRAIPPLGSVWISLFKDTSIVSIIAVAELTYRARVASVQTYRPIEIFTALAVLYFVITYPQFLAVNRLYHRFRVKG